MRGAARFATYIGRLLMVVGFLMIVFAWEGASQLDFIQGQFPYLLSGGIPGLAFIIIGAGLEYVQIMRQMTAQRARQMAELNLAVVKLTGYVRDNGGLVPAPDAEITLDARTEAERFAALDSSGHAFPTQPMAAVGTAMATAPAPTQAPAAPQASAPAQAPAPAPAQAPSDEMVVAGRSSFHDPECHLVTGRDDMATITRLEAEGQGLSPCRVCKP